LDSIKSGPIDSTRNLAQPTGSLSSDHSSGKWMALITGYVPNKVKELIRAKMRREAYTVCVLTSVYPSKSGSA
jgi:hypothetical protein